MTGERMFFHFHNLQDDYIKYYQATNKHRIDQIKLSRLSILYGASALYRRIQNIFQNQHHEKIVICAHLKHSKIHDFYIIAASLIYGYTIFHSNWHLDGYCLYFKPSSTFSDENLVYKLKITKCNLVILDDELDSEWMLPGVKYIKISDIYTQSIYNKSLSLCNYLSLVDSLGKERSDSRIQSMLNDQTNNVSRIKDDDVFMISFTEGKVNKKPFAKIITFGELYYHFKLLESLKMWDEGDILVVFITNPTYDWLTSVVLYYCLYRPNVYIHFLQRYMSTYWKILWEANEHAKNVFLQLGKPYKILNFLYPRQLEALFTLEEVSNECLLFTNDNNSYDSYIKSQSTDGFADNDNQVQMSRNNSSGGTNTSSPSNISKYIFAKGKNLIMEQLVKPDHTSEQDATSILKYDNINSTTLRSPLNESFSSQLTINSSRNQSSPQLERGKKSKTSIYIPKLHLKFSELRGVLSDKNVHFFLSGTHTDYNLCEMFSKIFGGKLPVIIYGCNEIDPMMTVMLPKVGPVKISELYKRGLDNIQNGMTQLGHYIGTRRQNSLAIVKSVDPNSNNYMVKCNQGELGFFVCNVINKNHLLIPHDKEDLVLEDGTYLGLDDVGFYYKWDDNDEEHFYWGYNINCSITKDMSYPYSLLMATSKAIQKSICIRYGLTTSVVRVETMKLEAAGKESKIITAVELITVLKADITQDIGSGFLKYLESVGLFSKYLEPNEIRVISMPWTYKGSVNYSILRGYEIYSMRTGDINVEDAKLKCERMLELHDTHHHLSSRRLSTSGTRFTP